MMHAHLHTCAARLKALARRAWKAWDNLGSTRNARRRLVPAAPVRARPRPGDKRWSRIAAMTL